MSLFSRGGVKVQALAVSGDKEGLYAQRDGAGRDISGMVFCPMKVAGIAVMRCWEYQQQLGCGVKCPNAVTAKEEKEIQASMRVSEAEPLACRLCGQECRTSSKNELCKVCSHRYTKRRPARQAPLIFSRRGNGRRD
jgi:hypothetical protein